MATPKDAIGRRVSIPAVDARQNAVELQFVYDKSKRRVNRVGVIKSKKPTATQTKTSAYK